MTLGATEQTTGHTHDLASLGSKLGSVRGRMTAGANLARLSWFRTGGPAELLFEPADADDLAAFLRLLPASVPVTVIGVGSNLLVRDGGVPGVVIRLGKAFQGVSLEAGGRVRAGAGAMDVHVARFACDAALSGLEFLVGVPGTIGGALAMNAGAYGREVKDCLISATAVDRSGQQHTVSRDDFGYTYRSSRLGEGVIITEALFQASPAEKAQVAANMQDITRSRADAQPIGTRTGGSTFKNPSQLSASAEPKRAWELIDAAGCRGARIGGASVSEKHCNFLISDGTATAADIEALGEMVRARVFEASGVMLQWEIKRIGVPLAALGAAEGKQEPHMAQEEEG